VDKRPGGQAGHGNLARHQELQAKIGDLRQDKAQGQAIVVETKAGFTQLLRRPQHQAKGGDPTYNF
jgi:hypothetical protein